MSDDNERLERMEKAMSLGQRLYPPDDSWLVEQVRESHRLKVENARLVEERSALLGELEDGVHKLVDRKIEITKLQEGLKTLPDYLDEAPAGFKSREFSQGYDVGRGWAMEEAEKIVQKLLGLPHEPYGAFNPGAYKSKTLQPSYEELETQNTRLREALEKTPPVEHLKKWAKWADGIMAIPQLRNPGRNWLLPDDVQPVKDWISNVIEGAHQAALAPPEQT